MGKQSTKSPGSRVEFADLRTIELDKNPNVVVGVSFDGTAEIAYGTKTYWSQHPLFVPSKGQLVVWSDYKSIESDGVTKPVPGFKIGDGNAYNLDLPFVGEDLEREISSLLSILSDHTENSSIHVSQQDRIKWNGKVTVLDTVENETLILRR